MQIGQLEKLEIGKVGKSWKSWKKLEKVGKVGKVEEEYTKPYISIFLCSFDDSWYINSSYSHNFFVFLFLL